MMGACAMRILVTGAGGLLGSHLVPYLRRRGHDVIALARTGEAQVHADLVDVANTAAVLASLAPEAIVNLAGITNVDDCERDPQAAFHGNVRIVESLVLGIRQCASGCHLIQISTDHVYDGAGPHAEQEVTLRNVYAFSKYAGELAAASVPSTVLRTNFFGPSACAHRESLSDWLVRALRTQTEITVFDDVSFSPLSLESLSGCIERAALERHAGVFNLGSREGMSKADFAFALAKALRLAPGNMRRGVSTDRPGAARRPTGMSMDSSRFERVFRVALPTLTQEIQSMRTAYAHHGG
jgi:dTDP-4-dehydrorhamnose reductase